MVHVYIIDATEKYKNNIIIIMKSNQLMHFKKNTQKTF